jgi:hypothetical protein
LPVLNLALATIGKKDGDLTAAKNALYDRAAEMVKQAQREVMNDARRAVERYDMPSGWKHSAIDAMRNL